MCIVMAFLTLLPSQIKSDETVVFYPTFARLDEADAECGLAVHGLIFEEENRSWRRGLAVAALRRTLGVKRGTSEARLFDRRIRLFLIDHERGKKVSVRIGDREFAVGVSGPHGHFRGTLRVPVAEARRLAGPGGWIDYHAVTGPDDDRRFTGRIRLIDPEGLSVISDIDDTVKHTGVRSVKQMLASTFTRPFVSVPGMVEVYQKLCEAGGVVHYVSASPWQLYEPLSEFFHEEGFPPGTFHLKVFRLKDSSAKNVLEMQGAYKTGHIEPILEAFPKRRFVFIGDSAQADPEIYANLARDRQDQVAAIWIRNATGEDAEGPRFREASRGLDKTRWRVFERPEEIEPLVEELLQEAPVAGGG